MPSAVFVTPILNTNSQPQLACSTSFTTFESAASYPGNGNICIGSSNTYNLLNLGVNHNVVWSLTGSDFATISSSSQSQVTVNGITNGPINLIATITNQCGQVDVLEKIIMIGNPILVDANNSSSFCEGGYQREQNKITVNSPTPVSQYQWHVGNFPGTREIGNISIISGQNTNQVYLDIPFGETNGSVYVRAKNTCGWSQWLYVGRPIVNCGSSDPNCTQCYRTAPANFEVYPNPSIDIVNIVVKDKNNQPESKAKISAELFDLMGQSKSIIKIKDGNASFSVRDLNKGIYVLKIYNNEKVENHQIIVN